MGRGDIVLVKLPRPAGAAGHEQFGNRPALVVHNDATIPTVSVIMVVPFTSNLSAQRFSHTIIVQPSSVNGLNSSSVLLISQLRAIDRRRIQRTIGCLEGEIMKLVEAELKKLLAL